MSVTVTWANDAHTIVMHTYHGAWGVLDFQRVVEENAALMGQVTHLVDLIIDFTGSEALPPTDLLRLSKFVESKVPANQRLLVIVCLPALLNTLITIARPIARKATHNMHVVNTLDDA